jgi:hypothetical protein
MIKMIDINERHEFVSKLDKSEPKTVFVLKNLNSIEYGNAMLKFGESQPVEAMASVIRACLIEIRQGGEVIKDITDDLIKSIPLQVLNEIQIEIMVKNTLSEDDAKN